MNKQQNVFTSEVDIFKFLEKNYRVDYSHITKHTTVGEYVWDWYADADSGKRKPIDQDEKEEAIKLLKIPKFFAELKNDELEDEIIKAYDNSYGNLIEDKFLDDLQAHIENQEYFSHYINGDGEKCGFYEASEVVFSITRKEIVENFIHYEGMDKEVWIDYPEEIEYYGDSEYFIENIDYNFQAETSHIFVFDEWKAMLTDYCELPSEYETLLVTTFSKIEACKSVMY